jgi:hypothetical protein
MTSKTVSIWRRAGWAFGLIWWTRRQQVAFSRALSLYVAAEVSREIVSHVDASLEGTRERSKEKQRRERLRLQETTSPLRRAQLRLPLSYPFEQHAQPSPPFTGVRKELGES